MWNKIEISCINGIMMGDRVRFKYSLPDSYIEYIAQGEVVDNCEDYVEVATRHYIHFVVYDRIKKIRYRNTKRFVNYNYGARKNVEFDILPNDR